MTWFIKHLIACITWSSQRLRMTRICTARLEFIFTRSCLNLFNSSIKGSPVMTTGEKPKLWLTKSPSSSYNFLPRKKRDQAADPSVPPAAQSNAGQPSPASQPRCQTQPTATCTRTALLHTPQRTAARAVNPRTATRPPAQSQRLPTAAQASRQPRGFTPERGGLQQLVSQLNYHKFTARESVYTGQLAQVHQRL